MSCLAEGSQKSQNKKKDDSLNHELGLSVIVTGLHVVLIEGKFRLGSTQCWPAVWPAVSITPSVN